MLFLLVLWVGGVGGFQIFVVGVVGGGVLPLRLLQLRWAGSNGELWSAGSRWSAVQGSSSRFVPPQIQQVIALARTIAAAFR